MSFMQAMLAVAIVSSALSVIFSIISIYYAMRAKKAVARAAELRRKI